jgi:hypothetical protein
MQKISPLSRIAGAGQKLITKKQLEKELPLF